ncbi:MAG: hypothetical protein V4735_06165 [Pseudomonadota bacterium]
MALRIYAIMLVMGVATAAQAAPQCAPSASVPSRNYPGAKSIVTSNNLILPTGKAIPADGQQLILRGRVLDSECAVVSEAIIELWQVSPFGRWLLAESDDLATPNPVFAGAGRSYTDIDGSFSFITAFPAPADAKSAPYVNIRVKANGLPVYSSAFYFANDARNDADVGYKKLPAKARDDVTIHMQPGADGALIGTIQVVLKGKAPYRSY